MDIKETIKHPSIDVYREIIETDTYILLMSGTELKKRIRAFDADKENEKKLVKILCCLFYADLIFLYDGDKIVMTDKDGVRGIVAFTSQKEIKDKKLDKYEQRTDNLPSVFHHIFHKMNDADAVFINPFTQQFCLDLNIVLSFFDIFERTIDYADREMMNGISGDYLTRTMFEHFDGATVEYIDYYGHKIVGDILGFGIDKKIGSFILLTNKQYYDLRVYLKDVKFIRDTSYDDDDDDDDYFQ